MKRKFLTTALLLSALVLQLVVSAAPPTTADLTYVGAGDSGFSVSIPGYLPYAVTTLKVKDLAGQTFPAYCADVKNPVEKNVPYYVADLESGDLFDSGKAARIRSILCNSYPFATLAEIETDSALKNLTQKQTITATQLALWTLTNGIKDEIVWTGNIPATKQVKALKDWYLSLAGTPAVSPVADIEVKTVQRSDGSLDIGYRASSDNKPITLSCAVTPAIPYDPLDDIGDGYQHILVTRPTDAFSIKFTGTQPLSEDAYLYLPVGGRAASQYLVGVRSGGVTLEKTAEFSVPTAEFPGGIRILKTASDTGLPMAGVQFQVSPDAEFKTILATLETDKDGIALIGNLSSGTYYVRESRTPAGYIPMEMAAIVAVGDTFAELPIKNAPCRPDPDPCGSIEILKIDPNNHGLAGAKFAIYAGTAATGEPLYQNLITDETGTVVQGVLPYGDYTVVETQAPAGYRIENLTMPVKLDSITNAKVKFINYPIETPPTDPRGTLHLFKFDRTTEVQLAGAEFIVYSDSDLTHEVGKVVSLKDAPAVVPNLQPGTYYVEEVKAPDGYLLDQDVQAVKISANQVTDANFYNTQAIATAGNYGTLLLAGLGATGACGLGWLAFLQLRKKWAQ